MHPRLELFQHGSLDHGGVLIHLASSECIVSRVYALPLVCPSPTAYRMPYACVGCTSAAAVE
eukprot:2687180-Amphidinium_carterae.3